MNVIEKIEISFFRSFSQETSIFSCKDLNVFSGKNDSGKSNILKALNLFFTEDKVDFYNYLDFKNDFSKIREKVVTSEQVKGKKLFKIRILFNKIKFDSVVLPEQFWIEKSWDKEGYVTRKVKDKYGHIIKHNDKTTKVDASATTFLKKIHFLYIPAIKDYRFFDYLKNEYQMSLGNEISKLSNFDVTKKLTLEGWKEILTAGDITRLLSDKIDNAADGMMKHFLKNTNEILSSKFIIPELDFSKVLDVKTEFDIPLSFRGDGVQTKFIPQILNEISRNKKADIVIWGFEEPENSFEYTNAQLLADKFKSEYSNNKQIFLTTHSFNFISLDGENISRYRVWKDNIEDGTKVQYLKKNAQGLFDVDDQHSELLEQEIGIIELNQELDKIFIEKNNEKNKLLEMQKEIKEKIEHLHKPILFVEDRYDQIYKIAWLKINEFTCTNTNFEQIFIDNAPFVIHKAEGASNLEGFLRSKNIDYWNDKKIIGLFDFDEAGTHTFDMVKNNWKTDIHGTIQTGLYRLRNNHDCFAILLLPVPERLLHLVSLEFSSYVEIENLLKDDFLTSNSFAVQKMITGNIPILEVHSHKKSELWKKLFTLSRDEFEDFTQLFGRVYELFGLPS